MKSYAKQFDESDEISKPKRKPGKVVNRREAKKQIRELIQEDEKIADEMWDEMYERELWFLEDTSGLLDEEEYYADQFHPDFRPTQYFPNKD